MRFVAVKLGLILVVSLIGISSVAPALAGDAEGPVSVQVDKSQGVPQAGMDPQGSPPPVTESPSMVDVRQTDVPGSTGSPTNDWELWLAVGLVVTGTAAGSISLRSKRHWDVTTQMAGEPTVAPPPMAGDGARDLRDFPLIPASTVGTVKPDHPNSFQIDRDDPSKGSIVVYSDNTWEVLDENGKPLTVNDVWESTTSATEAAGKYVFRGALGAVFTGAVMLPTGGVPALLGGTVVGVATGAGAEAVMPVPKVGQNDVVLVRIQSCKDEPQFYSPILEGYVTRRVVRFSTFHFAIQKDGSVAVLQDWTEQESVLNPSEDHSH